MIGHSRSLRALVRHLQRIRRQATALRRAIAALVDLAVTQEAAIARADAGLRRRGRTHRGRL
jgi:hypothetical protein